MHFMRSRRLHVEQSLFTFRMLVRQTKPEKPSRARRLIDKQRAGKVYHARLVKLH